MKKIIFTLLAFLSFTFLFAQDYFPLAVGNKWEYASVDSNETFSLQITSAKNIDNLTIYNLSQISQRDISELEIYTHPKNNNDILVKSYQNEWEKIFQHTYKKGDEWLFEGEVLIADFVGTVSVPAGTFHSCYFVRYTSLPTGYIFAPNIGLIKLIGTDGNVELKSYTVNLPITANFKTEFEGNLKGYPNPCHDQFTIENSYKILKIEIYNLSNELVLSTGSLNLIKNNINTSSLSSGIYFVRAYKDESNYSILKFIKQD